MHLFNSLRIKLTLSLILFFIFNSYLFAQIKFKKCTKESTYCYESEKDPAYRFLKNNPNCKEACFKSLIEQKKNNLYRAVNSYVSRCRMELSRNSDLRKRCSGKKNAQLVGCINSVVPESIIMDQYKSTGIQVDWLLSLAYNNNKISREKMISWKKKFNSDFVSRLYSQLNSGQSYAQPPASGKVKSKSKASQKKTPGAATGLKEKAGKVGGSRSSKASSAGSVGGHVDNEEGGAQGVQPREVFVKKALDCEHVREFKCVTGDKNAVLNPNSPKVPSGVEDGNEALSRFNSKDLKRKAAKRLLEAQVLGYLRHAYAMRLVTGQDPEKLRHKIYKSCNDSEFRKVILALNSGGHAKESVISQVPINKKDRAILSGEIKEKKTKYYNALKLAAKELRVLHSENKHMMQHFDKPPKLIQVDTLIPCVATIAKFVTPMYELVKIRYGNKKCGTKQTAFINMGQFTDRDPIIKARKEFCNKRNRKIRENATRMAQIFAQYPELNENITVIKKFKTAKSTRTFDTKVKKPLFEALDDHRLSATDDAVMKNAINGMAQEDGALSRIQKSVTNICDDPEKAGEVVFSDEAMTRYFFSCGEQDQRTLVADPRKPVSRKEAVKRVFATEECKKIRNYYTAKLACDIRNEIKRRKKGFTWETTKEVGAELVGTGFDVLGCYAVGAAAGRAFVKGGVRGFLPEMARGMAHVGKGEVIGVALDVGFHVYSDYSLDIKISDQAGRIVAGFGSIEDLKEQRKYKKKSKREFLQAIVEGFIAGKAFDGPGQIKGTGARRLAKLETDLPQLKKEFIELQKLKGTAKYADALKRFKRKIADPIAESQGLLKADVRNLDAPTLMSLIDLRRGSKQLGEVGDLLKNANNSIRSKQPKLKAARNRLTLAIRDAEKIRKKISEMEANGIHPSIIKKAKAELKALENNLNQYAQGITDQYRLVDYDAFKEKWPDAKAKTTPTRSGKRSEVVVQGSDGKQKKLGYINYTVTDGKAKVGHIEVKEKGVSELLYREMIEQAEKTSGGKKLNSIHGELAETNYRKYLEARDRGLDHVAALKETPAYKARAKSGFGLIDERLSVDPKPGEMPLLVTSRNYQNKAFEIEKFGTLKGNSGGAFNVKNGRSAYNTDFDLVGKDISGTKKEIDTKLNHYLTAQKRGIGPKVIDYQIKQQGGKYQLRIIMENVGVVFAFASGHFSLNAS